jgi:iron complex transport system ATP-binding protein
MSLLEIRNLCYEYDKTSNRKQHALCEVSFEAQTGSFTGIAGPNGSGKTTLLKLIQRLLIPKPGTVLINSRDLRSVPRTELAKLIASVHQRMPVHFEFSAFQMVLLGRTPHLGFLKWETHKDEEIAERVMEQTNTLQFAKRPLSELSAGEFQRVCIATALASQPRILLLDEPTSFLDLKEAIRLSLLLEELSESGIMILCSSHDLQFLRKHCTQVVLLKQGVLAGIGKPDVVLSLENLRNAFELDELLHASGKAV